MTHTPTPAEIETLRRKAKRHDLDCTRSPWASYCSCGADEALAILDRLSPPAPEVDEATVWTRKVLCVFMKSGEDPAPDAAEEYISGGFDEDADFIAARAALSELIASKDAEIERLSDELDELKNPIYCTICGSCGETGCGCTHKCLYPFSHPDVDADLAAQMVREMASTGGVRGTAYFEKFEAIARRYMEKLFTEDEARRSFEMVAEQGGDYLSGQSTVADIIVNKIRAERARKDGRCKCTFAQKMTGDGCDVCNPERAKDYGHER